MARWLLCCNLGRCRVIHVLGRHLYEMADAVIEAGSEALEKCDNVHHGLLRRLRVVVVVDNNSTIDLRQKPYQVANFGEGIEEIISIVYKIFCS